MFRSNLNEQAFLLFFYLLVENPYSLLYFKLNSYFLLNSSDLNEDLKEGRIKFEHVLDFFYEFEPFYDLYPVQESIPLLFSHKFQNYLENNFSGNTYLNVIDSDSVKEGSSVLTRLVKRLSTSAAIFNIFPDLPNDFIFGAEEYAASVDPYS